MAFNKSQYDTEYNRKHVRRKFIPFNDQSAEDMELLSWLATKDNVTAYVKQLIKDDFEHQKGINLAEKRRIRSQNGSQMEVKLSEIVLK